MNLREFIDHVIAEGIKSAQANLKDERERKGAISGFNACCDKTPPELMELLQTAQFATHQAMLDEDPDYWWYRYYELEVEWVCNCTSVVLHNQGLPVLIAPTCRAAVCAARILDMETCDN